MAPTVVPKDDGDQHPPVGDVGCEPVRKNDETGIVEDGDRHEHGVPQGVRGVEAHGEESGQEHGGQEGLHGQRRGDDCFEERGDLAHGARSGFLRGKHALGEAEVAGDGEAEDRCQRHDAQAADDDADCDDGWPKGDQ